MAENYDPLGDAIKLLIGERPEGILSGKAASALSVQDLAC
jgi:hypothetical protein